MSERTIQNGYLIAAQSDIEALRLRVKELEAVVRAADRMRAGGSAALDMTKEWHGGLCSCRKCKVRDELGLSINDYDTQRAAVGEIEEE